MVRQWSVSFGLALVVALAADGVSIAFSDPTPAPASPAPAFSGPHCSIEYEGQKTEVRVGDALSYSLGGCPLGSEIAPSQALLDLGVAARPGHVLVPVKEGKLELPELDVIDPKTKAVVAKTDPATIQVKSVIEGQGEEAMKPKDPVGYLGLGLPGWIQMLVAMVILVLMLAIGFVVVRWLKNKAKKLVSAVLPKKPYDVQALERLQKLLDAGHLKRAEWKKFAFGVSETLKFYLGHRYDFEALESTTSELFQRLDDLRGTVGPNTSTTQKLRDVFEQLDLVKFTDYQPTMDAMLFVWKEAKQVVETTRIQKIEPILKNPPSSGQKVAPESKEVKA